jgi:ketosteroid isomerase-like protein
MAEADPRATLALWSRRDDAVLANPLGPLKVGWAEIEKETVRVAAMFAGAVGPMEFEEVARVVMPDLGYVVGFERMSVRRPGGDEITPMALRVTTVFRREEDGWKLVLRHADRVAPAA